MHRKKKKERKDRFKYNQTREPRRRLRKERAWKSELGAG